jgi:hypothetical protein
LITITRSEKDWRGADRIPAGRQGRRVPPRHFRRQLLANPAIAHRRLAVGRRAVVVLPVGQCPSHGVPTAVAASFMMRTDDGSPTVFGRPRPFVRLRTLAGFEFQPLWLGDLAPI